MIKVLDNRNENVLQEEKCTIKGISKKFKNIRIEGILLITQNESEEQDIPILEEEKELETENMQLVVVKDRGLLNLDNVKVVAEKSFIIVLKSIVVCIAITIANLFI